MDNMENTITESTATVMEDLKMVLDYITPEEWHALAPGDLLVGTNVVLEVINVETSWVSGDRQVQEIWTTGYGGSPVRWIQGDVLGTFRRYCRGDAKLVGGSKEQREISTEGLQMQLDASTAEVQRLQARIDQLQQQVVDWETDFNLVAERILEEAENRGWCSEYESVVDSIQGRLRRGQMLTRTRDYTVAFSVSVSVNARDEDAAEETARDILRSNFSYYLNDANVDVQED